MRKNAFRKEISVLFCSDYDVLYENIRNNLNLGLYHCNNVFI